MIKEVGVESGGNIVKFRLMFFYKEEGCVCGY